MMFEPKEAVAVRYKIDTSLYGAHMKIINYVGKNKRVFDVGCATGYLDERFRKNGCYVVGVEIDKEAAKEAEHYCDNVIIGDIEHLERIPYPHMFFDVIVYVDILEHLKRPDKVLMRFKRYLAPDGYIVVSIPNLGYFKTRLRLLLGEFEYKRSGILDATHLRFFTLKTARRLIESMGYKILKIDYTGAASRFRILRFSPTWFALQFIIIAEPI